MTGVQTCALPISISNQTPSTEISFSAIDTITPHKIHTDLYPVIRDKDSFELGAAKKMVTDYLSDILRLSVNEKQFLAEFRNGFYYPELLFTDEDTISRVKDHPMALWKTAKTRSSRER